MAKETTVAKESKARPLNAIGKVPSGKRLNFDDDVVTVYNAEGKEVERGIFDESVYNREPMIWDDKEKNYKLRQGYRMVVE